MGDEPAIMEERIDENYKPTDDGNSIVLMFAFIHLFVLSCDFCIADILEYAKWLGMDEHEAMRTYI